METLSFQAPSAMKQRLEECANTLDRSKAYLIRQAVDEYLDDLQDYLEAKKYKASYDAAENISLSDVKKKYKLS